MESGGLTRTYAINIPDSYNDDPSKKWPLIIDFHGNGGTPEQQYENSMYYAYPDGQKYVVVYPAGVKKHWQGPSYAVPGVNDLQFTTDLLAVIRDNYRIDSDRVYASGKSNGGGFVDTLACSNNGDEFAAFAMAAAALYTDTSRAGCNKSRPILEAHGLADKTIPYKGTLDGNGGPLPSIPSWLGWWSWRDGCTKGSAQKTTVAKAGYNIISYTCNAFNMVVKHYQVPGLGHCWPSSTGDNYDSRKSSCSDRSLDFTPVVLDFFNTWDLTKASSLRTHSE
ncbi:alpha/beta-hydrolase [Basidiobolus meristosporus CBS 931.73]|uniref:feruloyl esterase n=1 Tax=Basidiobolus meristosporus CBS 931.73 TaxID=1314790 RepID=A0A1Y1Y0S6_9FUNG|nr:alpha/beta-hydrolase [Basidiobolus meristosporus CBS 931.73]|eukprot:ORX91600.1 alpha/beta-hydrolase [Basidiobolus meristosporus CBS 931.73]